MEGSDGRSCTATGSQPSQLYYAAPHAKQSPFINYTTRYDTIGEFNVDSKLNIQLILAHVARN